MTLHLELDDDGVKEMEKVLTIMWGTPGREEALARQPIGCTVASNEEQVVNSEENTVAQPPTLEPAP